MKARNFLFIIHLLTAPAMIGCLLLMEYTLARARAHQAPSVPGEFYVCFVTSSLPLIVVWGMEMVGSGLLIEVENDVIAERWAARVRWAAILYFAVFAAGLLLFLWRYHELRNGFGGLSYVPRGRRRLPLGVLPEMLYLFVLSFASWLGAMTVMGQRVISDRRG